MFTELSYTDNASKTNYKRFKNSYPHVTLYFYRKVRHSLDIFYSASLKN